MTGKLPTSFNYAGAHNSFSVADFGVTRCAWRGRRRSSAPRCSSSARSSHPRSACWSAGLIDAAVVGGVDSLCLTTLYGFHSLQLTSRPLAARSTSARDGISIGEAAAFALLERCRRNLDERCHPAFLARANRAMPITCPSPHPEGRGARAAIEQALSGRAPEPARDRLHQSARHRPGEQCSAQDLAVSAVFGAQVRAARPRVPPVTHWGLPVRSKR